MTVVHETEIDGIRCFWVDTGRPTLAASLLFRQGMCDEPLNESGWLHMLEHLALRGRGGGALQINGSVSFLLTGFDAHGPAAAVRDHLFDLTQWLSGPRLEGFERERGVLRAESESRGGPAVRAIGWRFGARGPGVSSFNDAGMARATPTKLTALAARVFTARNAVLVLDGPPPPDLKLMLPDGALLPPPKAVPCGDRLPAAYVDHQGVVTSGLVRRSMAATILPSIIERALREKLRNEAGAAYAPWSQYVAVDGEQAVILAGSDVNADLYPTLVPTVIESLRGLSADGIPETHLAEAIESMMQAVSDPYHAFGLAYRAANSAFAGETPESLEQILAAAQSLTVESFAEPMKSFAQTLLLGIPGDSTWNDELPMLKLAVDKAPPVGEQFRHHDWPATKRKLVIQSTRVSICEGKAVHSLAFDDIEAMFAYEDGGRNLVSSDGWALPIEFDEWARGSRARAIVDRAVPIERTLRQPARVGPFIAPRLRWHKRWWRGFLRIQSEPIGFWLALGLMATIFVIGVTTRSGSGMFWPVVWAIVASVRYFRSRSRAESSDL